MLDDIDARGKVAHPLIKTKSSLIFKFFRLKTTMLTPSNIHICFPITIKKKTDNTGDIHADLITVNNFFCALDKRSKYNKIWKR